jgi:hypothetical protein
MLTEELSTQPPGEAPFGPKNTFIAPSLLRACCACGLVQDKAGRTPGLERWISQRTYCEAHGVSPSELAHAHLLSDVFRRGPGDSAAVFPKT